MGRICNLHLHLKIKPHTVGYTHLLNIWYFEIASTILGAEMTYLCVSAQDFAVPCSTNPVGLLLQSSLSHQCGHEHDKVQWEWDPLLYQSTANCAPENRSVQHNEQWYRWNSTTFSPKLISKVLREVFFRNSNFKWSYTSCHDFGIKCKFLNKEMFKELSIYLNQN